MLLYDIIFKLTIGGVLSNTECPDKHGNSVYVLTAYGCTSCGDIIDTY